LGQKIAVKIARQYKALCTLGPQILAVLLRYLFISMSEIEYLFFLFLITSELAWLACSAQPSSNRGVELVGVGALNELIAVLLTMQTMAMLMFILSMYWKQ
jgi:hypothetical protein